MCATADEVSTTGVVAMNVLPTLALDIRSIY